MEQFTIINKKKKSDHKALKKTFKQYLMEKITTNID